MSKFSLEAIIKAQDRFSRPIAKMQTNVARFTRSAQSGLKNVDAMAGKLASGIKAVGLAAVAAGTIGALGMANVVMTGMEFEQSLINASAKFPGEVKKGTDAFKKLEETAKRIGSETEFTSKAAAEGLNFLAMAGFNAEQSVAALPGVVDLATAAQIELGEASDMATDSLGAFGLMTQDAIQLGKNLARVNDVIAKTTTTANTDVVQMFEAIKDAGPVATSAGASIETFSALVGELANAGIKGSVAGTTLKNVFLRLAAPPTEAAKALDKLKVKTQDSAGNMRDVFDILEDIKKKTEGMGTATKSGVLNEIFGMRAIAGANVLLAAGSDKLRTYRGTLEAATDASKKMAATMRDSSLNDLKSFESAVEGVKIAIFDVVKGPLREILQSLTMWTRENKDVIASGFLEYLTKIRENLPEIVLWSKRIGIGLAVFFSVAAAVKVATVALAAWSLAVKASALVTKLLTSRTVAWTVAIVASTAASGASTAATWLRVAATKALRAVLLLSQLATTQITAATVTNTASSVANTAATWARNAALGAHNAVTKVASAVATAYTAVTSRLTIKTIAGTVALVARKVAQIAVNVATGAGSAAMGLYAIATGRATAATAAGTPVMMAGAGAMKALAVSAGAATAALGAVLLAWDQASKLEAETDGLGITGLIGEMWDRGTLDPFAAYDARMNEKAIADAKKRERPSPQVVSPQERATTQLIESRSTEKAEITVKAAPGTEAEVTKAPRGKTKLRVQPSGAL